MNARNLKKLERLACELETLQWRIENEKGLTNLAKTLNRSYIESIGQAKRALIRTIQEAA